MAYRDDLEAAHARIRELEVKLELVLAHKPTLKDLFASAKAWIEVAHMKADAENLLRQARRRNDWLDKLAQVHSSLWLLLGIAIITAGIAAAFGRF